MHTTSNGHDIETARMLRDNELESAKTTAQKLWVAVWTLGGLLAVAVIGNTWQSLQHHWIIRYVEVDKASQQARIIEPAAERYEPSIAIVKGVLTKAINTLRSVPKDPQRMDEDFDSLKVCMTATGRQRLRDYEAKEHPRQERYPRAVRIVSLLQKTPRSYDARWQEWKYAANGMQDGPAVFYSGSFTFELRDPRTEQELTHCWAGIFFDMWSLGKDE